MSTESKKSGNARLAVLWSIVVGLGLVASGYALNFVKYSDDDVWADTGITTPALTVSGALTVGSVVSSGAISGTTLNISTLPTSTNGLVSGDIWANSNALTVYP
jgi:hypothetical protein